jgi:hypothetical protein
MIRTSSRRLLLPVGGNGDPLIPLAAAVVLLPCSDGPDQPVLLAGALDDLGIRGEASVVRRGHTELDANSTSLEL